MEQEFIDADDTAFRIGNWEAERVGYFTDLQSYSIIQPHPNVYIVIREEFRDGEETY